MVNTISAEMKEYFTRKTNKEWTKPSTSSNVSLSKGIFALTTGR